MSTATATIENFYLYSSWVNSGGRIIEGPSTATETKAFVVSGIPSGAAIESVNLNADYGSPLSGVRMLRVNSVSITPGNQTVPLAPTADGNGTYTVVFEFQAYGDGSLSDGTHGGSVTVQNATVTVTYTSGQPGPEPEPEPDIDWNGPRPISVFAPGVNRYNNNGQAVLHPIDGKLKMVANGAYEITMRHPIDPDGKWEYLIPGAIIRAPVPEETVENAFIGISVDLYRTNTTAELRESANGPSPITYPEWYWQDPYVVGSRVTCTGFGNYKCIEYDATSQQIEVPPYASSWWVEIASSTSGAAVLAQLPPGQDLYYLEDAGGGWYKMSTPMGIEGYVQSAQVTYVRHMTPEETDERIIEDQLFRVKHVTIDTDEMIVTVYAQHVSYDLAAILVRDVKMSKAAPAMAITGIVDGLMMPYPGQIATNLTTDENGTYTGAINGKNGIFAFLDPDSGIVPTFDARFARDNWDLFILKKTETDRGVRIRYGKNAQGISWKRSIENLVTRVVPVAKAQDGSDLYLPEQYVDSPKIHDYPVIYMQRLAVKGQVGKDDGTGSGTAWTEAALYDEMRAKAYERFTVDHADIVYTEISVNFEELGDTDEFSWLKGLEHVRIYDVVTAEDPRVGLEEALTVSEMEWDIIRRKVTAIKVATNLNATTANVAGYNITNNSIGSEKLTESAITEIANLLD